MLKECDIVITNPPFSLTKELLELIVMYKKDFIILGSSMLLLKRFPKKNFFEKKIFFVPNYTVRGFYGFDKENNIIPKYAKSLLYTSFKVRKSKQYNFITNMQDTQYKTFTSCGYKFLNIEHFRYIPEDYYGYCAVSFGSLENIDTENFDIIDFIRANDVPGLFARVIIKRK